MLGLFTHNWWSFTLRGLFAIIFGVLALVWPGATINALVILFGSYMLVDGVFAFVAGLATSGYNSRWWSVVLEGLVGIIVGLLTFFWPGATAAAIVFLIAGWAIITGILEIVSAIQIRHEIPNEWAMIISGLISVAMGVLLFVFPTDGAVSLISVVGIFSIIFGVALMVLSLRMRRAWRDIKQAVVSSAE